MKSGLTSFSGSTGQDARSLQISYTLQWEDSGLTGFGLTGFSGSSGQSIWFSGLTGQIFRSLEKPAKLDFTVTVSPTG